MGVLIFGLLMIIKLILKLFALARIQEAFKY